ncbi:uncharacterized protein LOC135385880 isoform X2 [Ornithodoros turicata]|uniref:uncharacterized protein LOC135385880 isoform X2 n=1 Tax=Ornithodoros turicata TaxID=34597 RepID=UPI003139FFDC
MAFKGILKLSILGGTLYAAGKSGVFSDSSRTLEQINKSAKNCPQLKQYLDKVPERAELNSRMVDTWNNGVKYVFKHTLLLPDYTRSGLSWCKKSIEGLMDIERKPTE